MRHVNTNTSHESQYLILDDELMKESKLLILKKIG